MILIAGYGDALAQATSFRHPGMMHSREDLQRMKEKVAAGQEPWVGGFNRLKADWQSSVDYRMQGPLEEVGRNPGSSREFDSDANAAYQCALLWSITGDRAYASKSREIINSWSQRLKRVSGADAVLMAGLGPFKMINAAEILRYSDPDWTELHSRQTEKMFKEAIYPTLKDFAPFANGNWDTAAVKTVIAIGIFANDREIFERGLRYYVNGAGDGRLTHYIINKEGQCQESGRDTQHSQLGLAHLGDCCEMAWNQGLNLYGHADNRLLKGFEYTAKFNLGQDVPFVETLDRSGKYHHTMIAIDENRGRLRPIYEQIYNHYVQRMAIPAPWTQKAAERIRPEGAAKGADHPAFGTLLFSRRSDPGVRPIFGQDVAPGTPAGLVAEVEEGNVANDLRWVESVGASAYTVKRAISPQGPFLTLAKEVKVPSYRDAQAERGKLYWYTVTASNAKGESVGSLAAGICTGMPIPWNHADVGAVGGRSSFDGTVFTIEGAGRNIGGRADAFQWAYLPLAGDGAFVARFVPQFNSQFSRFGLMIRTGQEADAPQAALLFTNAGSADIERPRWHAEFIVRAAPGEGSRVVAASPPLTTPFVIYGRMLQPYWMKLERRGHSYIGSISPDGNTWTEVGKAEAALQGTLVVGMSACSSLGAVTTRIMYDHISAPGWIMPQLRSQK